MTGLHQTIFNGMATDGDRLYVAQGSAPLLSSIPLVGGAPPLVLYGSETGGSASASTPVPLLPSDGGVYFDAFDDPTERLTWVSSVGGPLETVSSTYVGMFDWSQPRGFVLSSNNLTSATVDTVSLVDGAIEPFLTIDGINMPWEITGALVTQRLIHFILIDPSSQPWQYHDRRIDLATGAVHDEVALDAGNSQVFMGPTAICVIASDTLGISCLADDQPAVLHVPVASDGAPFPRYLDAQWVYVAVWRNESPSLSRFSLTDGHEQVLSTGAYPAAVTSFGDCVYAALVVGTPPATTDIWRFSPAP